MISPGDVVRPTHVEIDLDRLVHNYKTIAAHAGAPVMPILKANAYGHGLVRVAKLMVNLDVSSLGLAFLEEGIALREAGIELPILILGGILPEQVPTLLQHSLSCTAGTVELLQAIDACAAARKTTASVHLKVDTGMGRLGVHWERADRLLQASLACKHISVDGIYSHFATSDSADPAFARVQLERFEHVLRFYERHALPPPMRHFANSGAICQHPGASFDLVRAGIALYGVHPSDEVKQIPVLPAMRWVTQVVHTKLQSPGEPVSYGSTWAPSKRTRVVTLPVGYGDGYFRSLSSCAQVSIAGVRYPVVGRVCMDQLMVDVGDADVHNGDEVVLLGDELQASELARWAGTIGYEVLTNVNTRVPRRYVGTLPPTRGLTD